jgi:hypothetical protein
MLPNFIIIGAGKAGTTALYQYLRSHPQIFLPEVKEPDFFTDKGNWHRGVEWYEQLFATARPEHRAVGEASPSYTNFPRFVGVPERIHRVVPGAKLVYLVRHPIRRMQSNYLQRVQGGRESLPIEEALFTRDYLDISRYGLQLRQYLQWFPREQILLVRSEDLKERREDTLRRVLQFLGVDADAALAAEREWNTKQDKRALSPRMRAVRKNPMFRAIRRVVPSMVRNRIGSLFVRPLEASDSLSPAAYDRLANALRPDLEEFRGMAGDDFNVWQL